MPDRRVPRFGPATPARQTISWSSRTMVSAVGLDRPPGGGVAPDALPSLSARGQVLYRMTCSWHQILQAISCRVGKGISIVYSTFGQSQSPRFNPVNPPPWRANGQCGNLSLVIEKKLLGNLCTPEIPQWIFATRICCG